ncbi:hypothetical protein ARSEF1564_009577 [Beauveria bassiana]
MADWKLLGEVPDSEDEDAFDSQEPATGLDSTTTHAGAIPEINHQDIWEFIGSQKAAEPVHNLPSPNGSLSSSPLSSAQSVDGLPELDTMFLEGKESASRLGNSGEGPNDLSILRTYIDPENHALTTLADLSHSSSPNLAVNEDVALPSQDLGLLKNAHDLQRESVRLERSLRPRKPIQEHPYLLENAQYSSLIRQHGMRPVKMAMARARAARDEIPQDGEFQDDSQGNSLPDLSNSSQLLPSNDTDESGDFGLFNIPSSSPLRTSPWLSHRRSSNHGSSQGDTDNTSVADQDLPALHELLPNSQQNISSSTKRPNTTSGSSARKRKRHDIVDSDPMDVDSWGQDAPAASGKRLDAGPLPPIPRLQPSARRSVNVSPTKTVVTIVDSSSSEAEEHEEEEMRERQGKEFYLRPGFDWTNRQAETKRKKTCTSDNEIAHQRRRHKQQKITASFNRSTSTPSGQLKSRQQQNLQQLGSKRQSAPRPTPKPLSILDVIEPDAPQFLRVAARTAKTRVNQGRSSPSKKIIRLAERVDYIDAIVSLNEWKLGSIPQRQDVSEASKNKRKQVSQKHFAERVAGQPTATRTNFKQLRVATRKAGKFVKQTSTGGSARYLPSGFPPNTLNAANFASTEDNDGVLPLLEPTNYARRSERIPADSLRPSRPAMLEAEDVGRVAPLIFHRQKKFLDSIYQKNNRESSVDASDVRSEVSTVRLSTAGLPKIGQHDIGRRKQSEKQPKHRVRLKKARKPVRIDVDAPQFSHAAGPLPNSNPFEIEQTGPHTAHAEAKLAGLGPYGTVCHYLVQQWGWRRSGSIIGVIFDFFGSQNLEHLRNEEANASPRFLEQLAGEPSLAVEPGDKCFHVFLKLLALSIQKLRAAGAIKDIRNLVARIIPNHNRQHLKEQTVHERDLAALRNHHDLLATLFWAAPPELRPSPALIERLVAPETSHKEASLINIRCWGQIARFIVAKGEASTAFKPFHLWRNNIFQKMVQQFDSAAADIQQQLLALPSEVRHTISENVISSMVLMNKEAVGDVLQASITASLDVMEHAAHLEAATFCLNTLQLQHIYKQFGVWPPELNWNTLQGAISTLDLFVDYIAEFKENEESQQSESHILDSVQGDDALLLLDHEISERYFSMVRCILLNGTLSHGRAVSGNFGGVEQGVAVAARLAACFINGGLVKLHELFKRGRFGLFDGPIHKLDFYQRQYFVLVVVTLLKADIDNFTDAGFTLCELWLLLLVRPNRYLKYQSQLAEILRERGEFFLPSAADGLTSSPSYECNDILFEFAISTMRRSICEAAPNLRRNLTAVHSKALNLVMEQMKEDLKATSSQPVAHIAYVAFARRVISLIRTHGSEICVLDSFYYQISKDYSPSVEDPQLQIAAMVSYGLRLREGDPKVVQQLFFFLFNNFKMALISNNLDEEKKMLQKGMAQDRGITQFVLGKMLPAIIEATATKSAAYPLLDLYVWAAGNRLKRSTTTYCLTDAELPGVRSVLQTILNGIDVWIAEQAPLTDVRLHTLESFFAGFNLLWPSIYEYSLNQDISSAPWSEITELISTLGQYVISSKDSLCQGRFWNSPQRFNEFFAAVAADSAPNRGIADVDVEGFVDNIKQDVNRNWFEADGRISILTPGKSRGGGALQGVLQARWDAATLIAGIKWQFMEWLNWKKRMDGGVDPMEREEFEMRLF